MADVASLTAAACLLLTGCAVYHSQPLDHDAVDTALRPPALPDVEVAAAHLDHPLLQPLVIDGRDGFTPDEIALMTVVANPALRALRDERGVARAQVVQAGLLPNPQLGYTLDQPHGNADPTLVSGRSLGLSWDFTALLAREAQTTAARATAAAVDLTVAWQEWLTAQDARLRAFRLLSMQERLPLAREAESDAAADAKLVRDAVARREKLGADLALIEEIFRQAQKTRLALEQQIATERIALNLALGQPADAELALKAAPEFPALPADSAAGPLLDNLEKRRLDLVALKLGYDSAEASLRAAVRAQFPRVGLSFAQTNDTSDVRTHTYGVTIDLPLFDRGQGHVAAAQATRQQLFDEYVARVAGARGDVALILASLSSLRAQIATLDAGLPARKAVVEALAQAVGTGDTDVLSWHEARAALAARRVERSELQQTLLEQEVALEIASGRPLLNRPPEPDISP